MAHEDAFIPFDTAAYAADEYLVGQGEMLVHTLFVLPLQVGRGCHGFRWHVGPLSRISGFLRSNSELTIGPVHIEAVGEMRGRHP